MNNSRYKLLLLIVLPLIGLYLQSCVRKMDPCPTPPETIMVDLPQGYKNQIPYTGKDTLTFIRTLTGDTHTFIGQGKTQRYAILQIPSGDIDCPAMKGNASTEELSYKFVSSTFPSPIQLGIYYQTYSDDYFYVKFNNQVFERPTSIFNYNVYDSIQVRNKFYYTVKHISDDEEPISTEYYTLYNADYGILKFHFKNGEEWELLPK